jgi:trans-aconitate methyltransferase
MNEYQYSTYGNNISEVYDEFYAEFDPASIELLAKLAGDGPALELGIGTGRVAIPLHEKGIKLHGIDASEAMLSKLKAKGGGAEIKTLTGSFARFNIEQSFRLIYVIFNTFFALLTQEEQVQCFQTVSDHLSEDGAFLIEAFVPDLKRFEDFQTVRAVSVTEDLVRLEVTQHDPLFQHIISQHVVIDPEGNRLYPVKLRYAWPSELDLMAKIAGLSLQQRWSSWMKDEFTQESKKHISVYGH